MGICLLRQVFSEPHSGSHLLTGMRLRGWISVAVIAILGLTLTPGTSARTAPADKVAVIVNRNGALISASEADIRSIYLGERQFVGRTPIIPLHLPDGPAKTAFLQTVVGQSPKNYKLYWLQHVFQGAAIPPNTVAGPDAMVAAVAAQQTTVGYVSLKQVKNNSQVAVLFVISVP